MVQFNLAPITLGLIMGGIDAGVLPWIKNIHDKNKSLWYLIIPVSIYALQPLVFYYAMNFTSMTSMNLIWDLTSDILITFIGIFIIKEQLGLQQWIAVTLAFIAIAIFSIKQEPPLISG